MALLSYCLLLFGALCGASALVLWLPFIDRDMRLDGVGVAFFLILGSVAFAAGAFLEKRIRPPAPRVYRLRPGDSRFIGAMLKGAARGQLLFGFALIAFDGLWLWLTLNEIPSAQERRVAPGYPMIGVIISLFFIIIFALTALMSFYASFKMRSAPAGRIHRVLVKTPQQLEKLTITRIQKEGAPGDLGQRFLAELHTGSDELTIMVSEKHAAMLKQYVQHYAPQARLSEIELKV